MSSNTDGPFRVAFRARNVLFQVENVLRVELNEFNEVATNKL